MRPVVSLTDLLKEVHEDEDGAVTIETILIIAAIALPILIFLIKFGWPRIQAYFERKMTELESEGDSISSGGSPSGGS